MADDPDAESGDESGAKGGRGNLVGAIIAIVLAVAVIWLAHVLYKNLQLQKCEMEGRHDCVDIPQPSQ